VEGTQEKGSSFSDRRESGVAQGAHNRLRLRRVEAGGGDDALGWRCGDSVIEMESGREQWPDYICGVDTGERGPNSPAVGVIGGSSPRRNHSHHLARYGRTRMAHYPRRRGWSSMGPTRMRRKTRGGIEVAGPINRVGGVTMGEGARTH
jgi:hypothetical protein